MSIPNTEAKAKRIRPTIIVEYELGNTAEGVIEALGRLGWDDGESLKRVYCRGDVLVGALPTDDPDKPDGTLRIAVLPLSILRERITDSVDIAVEKIGGNGLVSTVIVDPPQKILLAIMERGYWGGKIKPLAGIVQAPTLRADGSILQTPGYDGKTGLFYSPIGNFPQVPERPTRTDAIESVKRLLYVGKDFPWLDESDNSAWLAMVLTMITRPAIDGCCPLFAATGNTPGAGKTLLVLVGSNIAYGTNIATQAFATNSDELRKQITVTALNGTPAVLFDNIAGALGGASLDAALTSRTWNDRILGQSRSTGDIPLKTVWCATGNNLVFGSDIARRVLPIRLESPEEQPEERTGFEQPDLLGFVKQNRESLAVDALTIIRAYFVAGCPVQPGGQFGSFENWSRVIRGAIVWLGLADPLNTRVTAKEQSGDNELLGLLIAGLEEADPDSQGLTVKEIENLNRYSPDQTNHLPALAECIGLVCGKDFSGRRFGNLLRKFAGRIHKGRKITSKPGRANLKRWTVEKVSPVSQVSTYSAFEFEPDIEKDMGRKRLTTVTKLTTGQPVKECNCGEPMVSTPAESGWVNWDCMGCGATVPARVEVAV